jgi:hypothetical protein
MRVVNGDGMAQQVTAPLTEILHPAAISAGHRGNPAFRAGHAGMRPAKKAVSRDDASAYHPTLPTAAIPAPA